MEKNKPLPLVEQPKKKKTITAEHGKFGKITKSAETSTAQKPGTKKSSPKTNTQNGDKKAKKKATEQNIVTAAKKANLDNVERESKYLYSEDCKTAKDKKEFRRKARATDKRYANDLKKLRKLTDSKGMKMYADLKVEVKKWKKATYMVAPTENEE